MEFGEVNVLGVVVSAVAAMVVGFIWFSPPLFEKVWLAEIGRSREEVAADSPIKFLVGFIGALLEAYILSALMNIMGEPSISMGVLVAVVIWVSFVATTSAANFAFAGRPFRLWLIENGNHLVTLLTIGAIVGAWQ